MTTIQTYLYATNIEVQVLDTSIFTTRNREVYARPVTVYKGINNPIQITVKNQDQKPVNLTGYTVQVDIQDPVNGVTVQSLGVSFANIQLGRGSFTIDRNLVNALDQRQYKLTFKTIRTSDNIDHPVYVDDNYGVPLDLVVLPAFNSTTVSPTVSTGTIIYDGGTI